MICRSSWLTKFSKIITKLLDRMSIMTNKALAEYFGVHRRYYRSVNLERDLDKPDAVRGYIPTERSADALSRVLQALNSPKSHRAWTITGVYGTGKSAFAHYLACLCSDEGSVVRQEALDIAAKAFGSTSAEYQDICTSLPQQPIVRAVAVGQREPLNWTILRALICGADLFWPNGKLPDSLVCLVDWDVEIQEGSAKITNQEVISLLREVMKAANTPVFFIIDELGKNLEYAAQYQSTDDLYLLQQIAELKPVNGNQVYFLGLLHQSFAGYSERLAAIEQSEWSKIQGRFEDIPFLESPSQMTRLIGQAIDHTNTDSISKETKRRANDWHLALKDVLQASELTEKLLASVYPLHPVSALVLPILCVRYAQNDRSLFTFLTSDEPHSFHEFLATEIAGNKLLPTLKLYQIYDYFVESVSGLASRINLQRWVEVQSLIQDARSQEPERLKLLKTIGVLNLITANGALSATPELVALAMCDQSNDQEQLDYWSGLIDDLKEKRTVIYRSTSHELRIWEGSEFDVEAAIRHYVGQERSSLATLLTATHPLKPEVAQRHYSERGTLRYFEQRYADTLTDLSKPDCSQDGYDGLILYWLESRMPDEIPVETAGGKPLIFITVASSQLEKLRIKATELKALQKISTTAPELMNDGVARKEVKHRLSEATAVLDESISQAFDWSVNENSCWIEGDKVSIPSFRAFQSELSTLCDDVYGLCLILDNELINRRELTSQGAKARRELLEMMLENGNQERMGLEGYGPEVAIYYSVLENSGIHRLEEGEWGFFPPSEDLGAGLWTVWTAIEDFCWEAIDKQQSLDILYNLLENRPYGVKPGVIPLILAAVLLHHIDDVSLYKDGTFIPILSSEHFELLVKDPSRYSIKHIEITGLRAEVFKELEAVLRAAPGKNTQGARNSTLLSVVKPLFQFAKKLPAYTTKTKSLSAQSQAVLKSLVQAQEPDELIFKALPEACGLQPISADSKVDGTTAKTLRKNLALSLQEIQNAYDLLLANCQTLLHGAFGVQSETSKLREDLRVRASYLVGQCIDSTLRRFCIAAVEESNTDQEWIEALVMIVADRPAESWSDDDSLAFEGKLSDLSRKFSNLEALQKDVAASDRSGFEACRVTVTQPDGTELNRVVWVDRSQEKLINQMVDKILAGIDSEYEKLKPVLAAKLMQKVLQDNLTSESTQLQSKRHSKKNQQNGRAKG
jgi:hypothetical protein